MCFKRQDRIEDRDENNCTAIDYAKRKGHMEIVNILTKAVESDNTDSRI